jgi:hypothetical protein
MIPPQSAQAGTTLAVGAHPSASTPSVTRSVVGIARHPAYPTTTATTSVGAAKSVFGDQEAGLLGLPGHGEQVHR